MSSVILFAVLLPTAADPFSPFVANSPAAEQPTGPLLKLDANGGAELAGAGGKIAVRDLISLRRTGVPLPPLPRGPLLITTAGDRIHGTLRGGDDRSLRFQPAFAKSEWNVPISAAALIWLTPPPADTPVDIGNYPWLPAGSNRDLIRLRNGDIALGTIEGFAAGRLRFKPETGDERSVPLTELSAIAFNPTLARDRKIKGPYVRMVLRDGTRLAAAMPAADAAILKVRTLFGRTIEIPTVELVSLDVIQGKAVYLADLQPKAVQTGFLGTGWKWAANRNVHGGSLRLLDAGGETSTFDRGIGTHPQTTLTYQLDGKYRRFEAVVGLDAATGKRGRAAVRILVDGQEQKLPEIRDLKSGPALPVRVDVAGAKQLTLSVDFGSEGDVQADIDWGDARLVE